MTDNEKINKIMDALKDMAIGNQLQIKVSRALVDLTEILVGRIDSLEERLDATEPENRTLH